MELSPERASAVLGEFADEIREYMRGLAGGNPRKPASLGMNEYLDLRRAFGANGPSVALFLKSWGGIAWRSREGQPHARDNEVTRLHHYSEALGPTRSPTWERALEEAGYQGDDPALQAVWRAAADVGMRTGGHHAALLAGGAAGELAQMPAVDRHFFLEMMPWIRDGHWPGGWDDDNARLKVF